MDPLFKVIIISMGCLSLSVPIQTSERVEKRFEVVPQNATYFEGHYYPCYCQAPLSRSVSFEWTISGQVVIVGETPNVLVHSEDRFSVAELYCSPGGSRITIICCYQLLSNLEFVCDDEVQLTVKGPPETVSNLTVEEATRNNVTITWDELLPVNSSSYDDITRLPTTFPTSFPFIRQYPDIEDFIIYNVTINGQSYFVNESTYSFIPSDMGPFVVTIVAINVVGPGTPCDPKVITIAGNTEVVTMDDSETDTDNKEENGPEVRIDKTVAVVVAVAVGGVVIVSVVLIVIFIATRTCKPHKVRVQANVMPEAGSDYTTSNQHKSEDMIALESNANGESNPINVTSQEESGEPVLDTTNGRDERNLVLLIPFRPLHEKNHIETFNVCMEQNIGDDTEPTSQIPVEFQAHNEIASAPLPVEDKTLDSDGEPRTDEQDYKYQVFDTLNLQHHCCYKFLKPKGKVTMGCKQGMYDIYNTMMQICAGDSGNENSSVTTDSEDQNTPQSVKTTKVVMSPQNQKFQLPKQQQEDKRPHRKKDYHTTCRYASHGPQQKMSMRMLDQIPA